MENEKIISLNEHGCYFLTLETVDLLDIFIKPVYKQIVIHSLNHFVNTRGFTIYGWCLMTDRLYLVCRAEKEVLLSDIRKGFKEFTTTKILEAALTEPKERQRWIFEGFDKLHAGIFHKSHILQCWQKIKSPVALDLSKPEIIAEYIYNMHYAPVKERVVLYAPDYIYSSATDYDGYTGLVKITKLPAIEHELNLLESRNRNFKVKINHR